MGLGSYSKTAPTSRHAEREEIHAPEGRAPPGRRKEGDGGWGERRNRAADSKKSNSAQVPGPACGKAGKTLSAGKCTFAICNDANAHNRPISKAQIRCTATESRPVGALHARCQKTQSQEKHPSSTKIEPADWLIFYPPVIYYLTGREQVSI